MPSGSGITPVRTAPQRPPAPGAVSFVRLPPRPPARLRVLPQDRGKALRRQHRCIRRFPDIQRPSRQPRSPAPPLLPSPVTTAITGTVRRLMTKDALGNGLALSVALRLQTGIGAGGVHKGDHRASELFCLPHQPHGLAIALGLRHAEVAATSPPGSCPCGDRSLSPDGPPAWQCHPQWNHRPCSARSPRCSKKSVNRWSI